MALGNYCMHVTIFDTFAPDVLNSLQKNMCICRMVHQLRILAVFQSTEYSTLHSLKCSDMPYVTLRTIHCFNFVTFFGLIQNFSEKT